MWSIISIFLIISQINGKTLNEKLNQASLYEERKQYEEAVTLYKEILNSREINKNAKFDIYLRIADIELDKLGRSDSAIKYLETCRAEYSDIYRRMDEALYRLGLAYEKSGKYQEAAEAYQTLAVRFQKSRYLNDALDGVERVFRKNFKEYVAFVGEEPITRLEFERELENIPPFAKQGYETEEGKQRLLKNIIQRKLLVKEAENRKVYLRSSYIDEMQRAREQALIRALYNEIAGSVKVDDKEIREYYEKNKDKYKIPATVSYKIVVVNDKETAENVYKLAIKGTDFDSLVAKYSVDEQTKSASGLRKDVAQNAKPEEVVKAAFSLKVNQISKPIKLEKENKYAVIKLVEKKEESYRSFDEVKESIKRQIESEKVKKAWDSLIDSLWNKYNVRILGEKQD
ncbi:MAG: peptidyl-prolyl cis-trans isomerase [candidate division WOR-3 bacterium]